MKMKYTDFGRCLVCLHNPCDCKKGVSITKEPKCKRCNDNGCPACDGTKGSKYNPEPF